MTGYASPFQTVLKVRRAERDQRRARLADAFRAEAVLAEQRAGLEGELAALRAMRRKTSEAEHLDVSRLMDCQRYELVLKARSEQLAGQEDQLRDELEQRRAALVEADRSVRAIELLDARKQEEFDRGVAAAELKQLDELAGQRAWRRLENAYNS